MTKESFFLSIFLTSALAVYAQDSCFGLVQDPISQINWERKTGMNYKTTYSYKEANEYCSKLSLCGKKWGIPALKELQTLVDEDHIPRINPRLFPYTVSDLYWSSTYPNENKLFSYALSFGSGIPTSDHEGGRFYVRCVVREIP